MGETKYATGSCVAKIKGQMGGGNEVKDKHPTDSLYALHLMVYSTYNDDGRRRNVGCEKEEKDIPVTRDNCPDAPLPSSRGLNSRKVRKGSITGHIVVCLFVCLFALCIAAVDGWMCTTLLLLIGVLKSHHHHRPLLQLEAKEKETFFLSFSLSAAPCTRTREWHHTQADRKNGSRVLAWSHATMYNCTTRLDSTRRLMLSCVLLSLLLLLLLRTTTHVLHHHTHREKRANRFGLNSISIQRRRRKKQENQMRRS